MHDGTWARRIMHQSFYVSRTKLSKYQHAVQTPPYQFQKFHKVAKISKSHPSNIRHMRKQSTLEFQELLYTIMFQLFARVEMYIEHQCTINVVHKYLFESIKSCEHTCTQTLVILSALTFSNLGLTTRYHPCSHHGRASFPSPHQHLGNADRGVLAKRAGGPTSIRQSFLPFSHSGPVRPAREQLHTWYFPTATQCWQPNSDNNS